MDESDGGPEPDLPRTSERADGVLEPGELCLVHQLTLMPATSLHVEDFNGDGVPDIATSQPDGGVRVRSRENDGSGTFSSSGASSSLIPHPSHGARGS